MWNLYSLLSVRKLFRKAPKEHKKNKTPKDIPSGINANICIYLYRYPQGFHFKFNYLKNYLSYFQVNQISLKKQANEYQHIGQVLCSASFENNTTS